MPRYSLKAACPHCDRYGTVDDMTLICFECGGRFTGPTPAEGALLAIHGLMSGKEWSPDTLDAIAGVLKSAGLEIRTPE